MQQIYNSVRLKLTEFVLSKKGAIPEIWSKKKATPKSRLILNAFGGYSTENKT